MLEWELHYSSTMEVKCKMTLCLATWIKMETSRPRHTRKLQFLAETVHILLRDASRMTPQPTFSRRCFTFYRLAFNLMSQFFVPHERSMSSLSPKLDQARKKLQTCGFISIIQEQTPKFHRATKQTSIDPRSLILTRRVLYCDYGHPKNLRTFSFQR